MERAMVILSGGLDSTTLLFYANMLGYEVHALSFDYGQRHNKELVFAEHAAQACASWKLVDIREIMKQFHSKSALLDNAVEMPHEHWEDKNQRRTVVPNRNMILLSIAAGFAEIEEIDKIFYGAHKNDRAVYPDCRPEFVKAVSNATREATYSRVQIDAPFMDMTKAQIVRLGDNLGVPFKYTWSCYEGGEKHCGKCGTCQERREAFKVAGVHDPTEYEEGT